MTFKLGEIAGWAPTPTSTPAEPATVPGTCPVGKVAYRSKADAQRAAVSINRQLPRHAVVAAFRCGWCGYVHLGHRR